MKYWLDTEFIEDGRTIDLISVGIVSEDGREFYGQNMDCDLSRATRWVRENVLPHLTEDDRNLFGRADLAVAVREFCDPARYGKPEFWGYYADYDWVAICQLFGRMVDLPEGWPMYCRDIKQWVDDLGNPRLPLQGKDEHHALADARWNRRAWFFLAEQ
jgi:hypothetical protein